MLLIGMVVAVAVYLEENGQTEAVERAEVRARVQGFLEEIRFSPGAEIAQGDVLYVIGQRQYVAARDAAQADSSAAEASLSAARAAVHVANAELATAEVAVTRTESEFKRQDELYKRRVIPENA